MSKITLDAETAAKLIEKMPMVNCHAPDGTFVGTVVSPSLYQELMLRINDQGGVAEPDRIITVDPALKNVDPGI